MPRRARPPWQRSRRAGGANERTARPQSDCAAACSRRLLVVCRCSRILWRAEPRRQRYEGRYRRGMLFVSL
jgi:hypothetical protein